MTDVKAFLNDVKTKVKEHPLISIAIAGVLIRMLIIPTTLVYDSDYWAMVIRNINAGEGLYGVEGYYYTPVWGYFLGLISEFQTLFLDLGEMGVRVVEALPIEVPEGFYLSATITSVAFLFSIKIPLMVFDLVLGYLMYRLVLSVTDDRRKAITAFALIVICPSLIAVTCTIGMPDVISATFLILCIILIRDDCNLIGGMCFAVAVLNKFFPAFVFFVLLAYIITKNRDDKKKMYHSLGCAIVGGIVMALILFIPLIINGEVTSAFSFLSDRTGSEPDDSVLDIIAGNARLIVYAIVVLISIWMAYDLYKRPTEDPFKKMMRYCFLIFAMCFVYPPAAQYVVILLPFVVYMATTESQRYRICWILIAVGGFLMTYASFGTTLLPLAEFTDLLSVSTAVDIFEATLNGSGVFTIFNIYYVITAAIQYVGIILCLYYAYKNKHKCQTLKTEEN